ncbi:MAG: M48 family metalloprotease [Acidobacteria bacterium]|nr:M48 family metalloprotease [Acidobacteriota bacterium]
MRNFPRAIQAAIVTVGLALISTPAWARFQIPPPCKNSYTVEQEQTEGAKVAAEVFKQMPVLPDSSPVSQYVRNLGAKLVNVTPGYRWPFNFHVVASEEINAFALPGGAMFVNLGAINAAETEAQLAGVMAHELSHVVLRHSTCNITKQQAPRMWAGLGQLAAGVLLGNGALGSIAQQGIGTVAGLSFLRMSRDDEKQADLLGTDILYDAGYDPRGLVQFFEIIQAKYGEGGAQIFSDHPNPGNRTQYVSAEIASLPPRSNPRVTSAEFTRAKALSIKEKTYNSKEVEAGAWRSTGKYALLPGGPATIIPAAATSSSGGSSDGQSGPVGRLSRASLGLNDRMTAYQGATFSMNYPSSWQKGEGQNGNVAFVPPNGAGQAGIAYGAIVDGAKFQSPVRDRNALTQATSAIARQLSQDNGGMTQAGELTTLNVGGQMANAVELRGKSPVSNGNNTVAERDLLVTVARPDGAVSYIVFVSPEPDFQTLKPLYNSMLQSFRVR